MSKCINCGRDVVPLEMNLTRKLINRSADKFYCKTCLAKKYSCTEKDLDDMIEKFRRQGCALFT